MVGRERCGLFPRMFCTKWLDIGPRLDEGCALPRLGWRNESAFYVGAALDLESSVDDLFRDHPGTVFEDQGALRNDATGDGAVDGDLAGFDVSEDLGVRANDQGRRLRRTGSDSAMDFGIDPEASAEFKRASQQGSCGQEAVNPGFSHHRTQVEIHTGQASFFSSPEPGDGRDAPTKKGVKPGGRSTAPSVLT